MQAKKRKRDSSPRPRNYPRLAFVLLAAAGGGYLLGTNARSIVERLLAWQRIPDDASREALKDPTLIVIAFVLLGILTGAFVGNLLLNIFDRFVDLWERMDVADRVTLFVGVFAGLIAALPFLVLFQALNIPFLYIPLLVLGLTLGFSALSIYALQSMEELLPWNRMRGRHRRSGIKILDTNVIIDGRIYDVAKTGFLEGQIYVPGFVLDELQHIADSHDPLRRQRGKRGLEVLRHMQADFPMEVRVHDKLAPDSGEDVDARLVRLARVLGADLLTNDHNLNRVAVLQDVKVLNLNDLALSLRPNVLPQETLELSIIREGNQAGQGVGYLEDGTMVVIENGKGYIGETIEVVVTQVIQTERGKMIFAEVEEVEETLQDSSQRRRPLGRRQNST